MSQKLYRSYKNPSLEEGGCGEGAAGWAKELQQMPQSLTRGTMYEFNYLLPKTGENMRKLKNSELNRLDTEAYKQAQKAPLIVVLDNVRSLHNIGAVFRTADAFRIEKIWLCGITATPPHKDIHKTALGATQSVDWEYAEDANLVIHELKEQDVVTIAVEQAENAVMLHAFQPEKDKKYALVFGHEVKGVSQQLVSNCDTVIEIPQYGTKHSLNLSVSAGIVLWDIFNKQ